MIRGLQGKIRRTVETRTLLGIPPNPVIESSEATPPRQGRKRNSRFNNIYAATMYNKRRKQRSEAQRRHDAHLHKSRCDPHAYTVATLEDMSQTVQEYRKRTREAEADAESSKEALATTEHQVCFSVSMYKWMTV